MIFNFKKIFFFVLFLAVYFGFKTDIVFAGTSDNVYGWAWSGNFGWISFNCIDRYSCGTINYGVNANRMTGHFSGYAWSERLGWISFEESSETPDLHTFKTGCLDKDSCIAVANCSACYNYTTEEVYGWAKILILGDNGWIKFNHGKLNSLTVDSIDGKFAGYGWNDNSNEQGVGWISFSCQDSDTCDTAFYQVAGDFVNNPPKALNPTAPNWSFNEVCTNGVARRAFLEWTFSDMDIGSTESAYEIIVSDSSDFSDPILDTGKCIEYNAAINCHIAVGVDRYPLHSAIALDYNKTYYWRVKVWDERDLESNITSGETFTTYKHEFPNVSFDWSPDDPNVNEDVSFDDTTSVSGGATIASHLWTFEQGTCSDTTIANPTARFYQGGSMNVSLQVTDSDGYTCTNSANVENVSLCLPLWRESNP